MMEFCKNIVAWFVENKVAILGFLTSAEFLAFATQVFFYRRNSRQIRTNTASNEALNNSLVVTTGIKDTTDNTQEQVHFLTEYTSQEFARQESAIAELAKTESKLMAKIDAIIEVQTIVYSTIKDEEVRSTVNSILTAAKYADIDSKSNAVKEVEALKGELQELLNKAKEGIEEKIQSAKEIITDGKEDTTIPMR